MGSDSDKKTHQTRNPIVNALVSRRRGLLLGGLVLLFGVLFALLCVWLVLLHFAGSSVDSGFLGVMRHDLERVDVRRAAARLRAAVLASAVEARSVSARFKVGVEGDESVLRSERFQELESLQREVRRSASHWQYWYMRAYGKDESHDQHQRGNVSRAALIERIQEVMHLDLHPTGGVLCRAEWSTLALEKSDGPLLLVLAAVGFGARRLVLELDSECMRGAYTQAANLVAFHGFSAALVYSCWSSLAMAQHLYEHARAQGLVSVVELSTLEKPDSLGRTHDMLEAQGWFGELDLLSININSIEYQLWRSLVSGSLSSGKISPRVIALEYQPYFGSEERVYSPAARTETDLDRHWARFSYTGKSKKRARLFGGASLAALEELAHETGYVLVGCLCSSPVAIFVRADLAQKAFMVLYRSGAAVTDASRRRLRAHCLTILTVRMGDSWSKDLAGMWDEAQTLPWLMPGSPSSR
ncbi:hypothetical protein FVE85_1639 [Porphyridium purpureum]|uniref:Uncharacterized protein n=1 Tax=Porphyridium purpureum TaxID=35688 RepID=A0A5J4YXT1_PORPP|nr:hypothetical protein FVE85_1639 [Porphyridium purpureum]|eukprot:POR7654..scf209_3